MPTCFIDKTEHKIELAETPMVENWLKVYSGKSFKISKKFDFGTCKKLYKILKNNGSLVKKFKLDFDYQSLLDLCNLETLSNIHLQVVQLQKKYKNVTNLLNKNTNGEWNLIHDLIHIQEKRIRSDKIEFSQSTSKTDHDPDSLTKNWCWEERLTQHEFHKSASFDEWHINIPFAELGRHPYECFLYSPNTWRYEGTMSGQLGVRLEVQLRRAYKQPEVGYHEWCTQQKIPAVGYHFPLANFSGKFPYEILNASEITIQE